MFSETFYAGLGKVIYNDNVLNVFDDEGRLLLEVVKVDDYYLPRL